MTANRLTMALERARTRRPVTWITRSVDPPYPPGVNPGVSTGVIVSPNVVVRGGGCTGVGWSGVVG